MLKHSKPEATILKAVPEKACIPLTKGLREINITVVLDGRKGFIRQAIRSGVPIVPVATTGGPDTVFVLSEGRTLAKILLLKKLFRCDMAPLILGFPFGITLEAFPMHIPLPAKIRTEILDPVEMDKDLIVSMISSMWIKNIKKLKAVSRKGSTVWLKNDGDGYLDNSLAGKNLQDG